MTTINNNTGFETSQIGQTTGAQKTSDSSAQSLFDIYPQQAAPQNQVASFGSAPTGNAARAAQLQAGIAEKYNLLAMMGTPTNTQQIDQQANLENEIAQNYEELALLG